MAQENAKKVILIYILDILREYSDSLHPLTQSDIIKKIESKFGMTSERKAISRNIDNLIDFGYEIVKCSNGGYFLLNEITDSEMSFIVDSIFSSYSIPSSFAKSLIEKLCKNTSIYTRTRYRFVHKIDNVTKTKNKEIFYNIDTISEAIEKDKKVKFQYLEYDENCNLTTRKKGKIYEVNPYFLASNKGKYYLVCNYEPFEDLSNYRVDLMKNIEISSCDIKPISDLEKYKNGLDKGKYISEHIYMFSGDTVTFKVKLISDCIKNDIVDWFGNSVRFAKNNDEQFAFFSANENAGFYWCLQYLESVEIVEPQHLKEKLIKIIEKTLKNYKKH